MQYILNCRGELNDQYPAPPLPWTMVKQYKLYNKILPDKLYKDMYLNNRYMKDNTIRFYRKTGSKRSSRRSVKTKRGKRQSFNKRNQGNKTLRKMGKFRGR